MSTMTSEDKTQMKVPEPTSTSLHNWAQNFYLYSYCYSCPIVGGMNGQHVANGCKCGCHVIAMFRWIEAHAKDTSLEKISKYIAHAEAHMKEAYIPIRAIDELRKIREQAIIESGSKPL